MKVEKLVENVIDFNSFQEIDIKIKYLDNNIRDAIKVGIAKIKTIKCVICINNSEVYGGTIGRREGEKVARALDIAYRRKLPIIFFLNSGGARIQEGILALVQLTKIVSAIHKYKRRHLLLMSIICDYVYGGITASLVGLSDIIIMEENSRLGFAGPKVIEETYNRRCENKFQSATFAMESGLADLFRSEGELRETIFKLLKLHR